MNYNGNWTNLKTSEEIRFKNIDKSDNYILYWTKDLNGFNNEQTIRISRGDKSNSHIQSSLRFGEVTIINIDSDYIKINGDIYKRN